jgi:cytochrome oxidase Cu insertion factor (SCO1/SenC/PrrC family)
MSKRVFLSNFVVVLCLQILIAGLLGCSEDDNQQPKIAEAAPLFQLESLHGDTVTLASMHGKFVVIHFAASW